MISGAVRRCAIVTSLILAAAAGSSAHAAIALLGMVPVGVQPGPVVVDPALHNAYIGNRGSSSISVINTETLAVTATLPLPGPPSWLAIDPTHSLVYAAIPSKGVIATVNAKLTIGKWTVGGAPDLLVVDTVLNRLFVADTATSAVKILGAQSGAPLGTVPLGAPPVAMTLNIATHVVLVATSGQTGAMVAINAATGGVITTVAKLPKAVVSMTVDPLTNVTMLTSPTANRYAIVEGNNNYAAQSYISDLGCGDVMPCTLPGHPRATAYDASLDLFYQSDDSDLFFGSDDGTFGLDNYYGLFPGSNGVPTSGVELPPIGQVAVNPTSGQVAILGISGDAYLLDTGINPRFTQAYHELNVGKGPDGLAFDPIGGRLFIANGGDKNVTAYDVRPDTAVAAAEADNSGNNVDYNFIDTNPATGMVYTLRFNHVYAINEAKTGAAAGGSGPDTAGVTPITLGSIYSFAVAVSPATNKIYAAASDALYSINGKTNVATAITGLPANAQVRALGVDTGANQILAWDYFSSGLLFLNGSSGTLLKNLPINIQNASILVDDGLRRAYVVGSKIAVINLSTRSVVATLTGPANGATATALNPTTRRLYVSQNNPTSVQVFNTNTNTLAHTVPLAYEATALGTDPITGKFYVAGTDSGGNAHLSIYSGATNQLLVDYSSATNASVPRGICFTANPLTDTLYMGSVSGGTVSLIAIDGRSDAISVVPPNPSETDVRVLATDLGSSIVAGGGENATNLWFPTSHVTDTEGVPFGISAAGISDSSTIATAPLFRTRSSTPRFTLTATSSVTPLQPTLIPRHAFIQVDGWQGTWKPVALTLGTSSAQAAVTLPTLAQGRHILYSFTTDGDVATVQVGVPGTNSGVISAVVATVFTVE